MRPSWRELSLRHIFASTSEACEKNSQWLWKESCVSTCVRKPRNTCVSPTAMIIMTLAVKVALNPNTTNQPTKCLSFLEWVAEKAISNDPCKPHALRFLNRCIQSNSLDFGSSFVRDSSSTEAQAVYRTGVGKCYRFGTNSDELWFATYVDFCSGVYEEDERCIEVGKWFIVKILETGFYRHGCAILSGQRSNWISKDSHPPFPSFFLTLSQTSPGFYLTVV